MQYFNDADDGRHEIRDMWNANMQILIVHDFQAANVGKLTHVVFNMRAIYFIIMFIIVNKL